MITNSDLELAGGNIDKLFETTIQEADARSEGEYPDFTTATKFVRCACGALYGVTIPVICEGCKQPKAFWAMIDGRVLRLQDMKLDHLTNCIKMLAEKADKYPPDLRSKYEIALDIMYLELGSRGKEMAQASGILKALRKNLDAK